MGDIYRIDSFAMEAVAESLQTAASDITCTFVNWPAQEDDSVTTAVDLHAESARLWTESVVERLEASVERAREIANALERQQVRQLR